MPIGSSKDVSAALDKLNHDLVQMKGILFGIQHLTPAEQRTALVNVDLLQLRVLRALCLDVADQAEMLRISPVAKADTPMARPN